MANEYEKEEGGPGFVMGLLTGTVLGAGLGMLFAPKPGSELRDQLSEGAGTVSRNISEGANTVSRTATEGYRRAASAASTIAEKSRDVYGRAREAVARGAEEVKRYRAGEEGQSQPSESRPARSVDVPVTPNPPGTSSGRSGGI